MAEHRFGEAPIPAARLAHQSLRSIHQSELRGGLAYDGLALGTELEHVIRVAEFRAALRKFLRQSERAAARRGLTPQRYLLLLMIKGSPDGTQRSTVTELSARLQLAKHTVTELVARAEKTGLIRRQVSERDRRIAYLSLTAKGERQLAGLFGDLEADRRALGALIERVRPLNPRAPR